MNVGDKVTWTGRKADTGEEWALQGTVCQVDPAQTVPVEGPDAGQVQDHTLVWVEDADGNRSGFMDGLGLTKV